MSEPKKQFMQYDAAATRVFYRLIAKHENGGLRELQAAIRMRNGEIGNVDFTDIDIRDGETLLCERHRMNVNKEHWSASAEWLDTHHAWDADGVWFPVKEDTK